MTGCAQIRLPDSPLLVLERLLPGFRDGLLEHPDVVSRERLHSLEVGAPLLDVLGAERERDVDGGVAEGVGYGGVLERLAPRTVALLAATANERRVGGSVLQGRRFDIAVRVQGGEDELRCKHKNCGCQSGNFDAQLTLRGNVRADREGPRQAHSNMPGDSHISTSFTGTKEPLPHARAGTHQEVT